MYLICDDYYGSSRFDYPKFFSSYFFEIVDSTPSKYWISRMEIDDGDGNKTVIENVGFLAMFDIPSFYYEVVEGELQEFIDLFNKYRRMLNVESNNDNISKALSKKVARFSMENKEASQNVLTNKNKDK